MSSSPERRRACFILVVGALVAGSAAIALTGAERGALKHEADRRSAAAAAPGSGVGGSDRPRVGAARVAVDFTGAYLRYQAGAFERADREALARNSTSEFGSELLAAPVRVPPGQTPRQARIIGARPLRVTVSDGRPAVEVSVIVAANGSAHPLRVEVVEAAGVWRVAGIGP